MSDLRFTVWGVPVPQGSMTHVGDGRLVHKPALIAWRRLVLHEALQAAAHARLVIPIDEPVEMSAVFYLPAPKRPRWPLPAVKPDLDKLQRAIGDALAPKQGTRLLAEDSRITRWRDVAKFYANPGEERAEITLHWSNAKVAH